MMEECRTSVCKLAVAHHRGSQLSQNLEVLRDGRRGSGRDRRRAMNAGRRGNGHRDGRGAALTEHLTRRVRLHYRHRVVILVALRGARRRRRCRARLEHDVRLERAALDFRLHHAVRVLSRDLVMYAYVRLFLAIRRRRRNRRRLLLRLRLDHWLLQLLKLLMVLDVVLVVGRPRVERCRRPTSRSITRRPTHLVVSHWKRWPVEQKTET